LADLSIDLFGRRLATPLILSSGPLSYSAEAIQLALTAGAAGAVTKTISRQPAINPTPHMARASTPGSLLNTEKWADLTAEQWIERELPALRSRRGFVIASVGHAEADVQAYAAALARAGVDALEVVSYQSRDMAALVRAAKAAVNVPVLAKVSANWPDLPEVVGACVQAGADGITAIDSIGPVLQIDIETARPSLGGPYGQAWLSGAAIKPIAIRVVADIARRYDIPILGVGGVTRAEDIVEMMMAGATAVQVHTAPLLKGLEFFARAADALGHWLDAHGYSHVARLRGLALPYLLDGEDTRPLGFHFDPGACNACRLCVKVCAYRARTLAAGKQMNLDRARCRSCGLCASVCPTGALHICAKG